MVRYPDTNDVKHACCVVGGAHQRDPDANLFSLLYVPDMEIVLTEPSRLQRCHTFHARD